MMLSTQPIRVTAPAKLNLMLHITGQRADGYHELQTLFQLLDWGDVLTFARDDRLRPGASGLPVKLEDNSGLSPTDNLVWRAATALASQGSPPFPVRIQLDKRVPTGGGLGGGSSDAATTLLVLNRLWGFNLGLAQLTRLGLALGADIPVFLAGTSAWAEGVGERLTPVQLPAHWYLIAHPDIAISTGRIFTHPGLTRNSQRTTIRAALEEGNRNDCEPVVRTLYPAVDTMLKVLDQFGDARLTGTGACGYVAFDQARDAQRAARELSGRYATCIARASNQSTVPQPFRFSVPFTALTDRHHETHHD